jgi:thiol-activated cytolysin
MKTTTLPRVTCLLLGLGLGPVGCGEMHPFDDQQPDLAPTGDGTAGEVDDDDDWPQPPEPTEDTDGDEDEGPDHSAEVDAYILGLGHLELPPAAAKAPIPCDPNTMNCPAPWEDDQGRTCELQYYAETVHLDNFGALQPESPALWPGAVIRGADVMQGFLSAIGLERAPVTFSLSLENLAAAPSATMESPSLSAFRDARNEILAGGVHGATPAQISYEIHSVESRSQLSIHVGASVDWNSVVDLDAMFGFDDGEFSNRYLFNFTQTYYTVDLDSPPRPSSFFENHVSVEDLQQFSGPDNPPMYVQSIAYGRRVIFGIESNDDLSKIVSAVDAAFAGLVEVEVDVEARETLGAAKITAAVIGGDGEAAVNTILGIEELLEYITSGGNYSSDSPGHPIAYKLAYLDNASARLALTAEYPQRFCQ